MTTTDQSRDDWDEAIRAERAAWERVEALLDEVVALCAEHRMWHWGDTYGGSVLSHLFTSAEAAGLLTKKPVPPRLPIPAEVRQEVFRADSYRCRWCNNATDITVDHIVPVRWGGTGEITNLQTLCRRCNSKKGDRLDVNAPR